MANIRNINFNAMINKASNIAAAWNEMQRAVKQAFERIAQMSSDWNGGSYDRFVETVNRAVPSLNNLFHTVVSDIPHEIAAKAKAYAASTQTPASASFSEATVLIINEVSKTNRDGEFRFLSDKVASDQTAIKGFFDKARQSAERAKAVCQSLKSDWDSVSGDTNIYDLIAAFKKLDLLLVEFSSALDQQIAVQELKINAAETAASAAEKVNDIKDDAVDAAKQAAAAATDAINQSIADWKAFFM